MARGKKEPAPPRSLFNSSGGAVIKVDANARATPRVAHGLNDLEGHCARLQALLSQVEQQLTYVTAENEQLKLALAPEVEPEPVCLSIQLDFV